MTKTVYNLTDEEIEECIDGSSDIKLIREIFDLPGIIEEGWIDCENFADSFARAIEGFISADKGTDDWEEAFENNWNWGYDIADNINIYLSGDNDE